MHLAGDGFPAVAGMTEGSGFGGQTSAPFDASVGVLAEVGAGGESCAIVMTTSG